MTNFAKTPTSLHFSAKKDPRKAEAQLRAVLSKHEKKTRNIPITREKDVLLNEKGLVAGRYRLSTVALKTLCSKLVPGLGQAMSSVAGLNQNESELDEPRPTSLPCAIRWLNDSIRLRFVDISGFNMVVDTSTKRVEGFVGRTYQFFPNKELYEQTRDFLAQLDEPPDFWEAVLSGRRLMLRYRSKSKIFSIPVSKLGKHEPFYGGFHFANSEVGECSLRAAAICIRQWGGNNAVSPFFDGGKIAHVRGPQFDRRFKALLVKVSNRAEEVAGFKAEVIRLINTNLGLGVTKNAHDKQLGKITAKLNKRGLPARFSKSALECALKFGTYKFQALQRSQQPMDVYATRTAYDVFNAITFESRSQEPELREKAEQLAYDLLSGRLLLT